MTEDNTYNALCKRIRCRETKKIYKSIKECCLDTSLNLPKSAYANMNTYIKKDAPLAGYHFDYVDKDGNIIRPKKKGRKSKNKNKVNIKSNKKDNIIINLKDILNIKELKDRIEDLEQRIKELEENPFFNINNIK